MMQFRAFVLRAFHPNDLDIGRGMIAKGGIGGMHLHVGRRASDPTIAYPRHFAGNRGKRSKCAEADGG